MQILRKKSFIKSYAHLPRKIQDKADEVLIVFEINPVDASLSNHALKWRWIGYRSFYVTGDYRIIWRELSGGRYEFVEVVDIGTHSQLYG